MAQCSCPLIPLRDSGTSRCHPFPSEPESAHGKIGSTTVPWVGIEILRVYLQYAPRLPNVRHYKPRLRLTKHRNPHIRNTVSGVSRTTNEPMSPRRTACRAQLLLASGCWLTLPSPATDNCTDKSTPCLNSAGAWNSPVSGPLLTFCGCVRAEACPPFSKIKPSSN